MRNERGEEDLWADQVVAGFPAEVSPAEAVAFPAASAAGEAFRAARAAVAVRAGRASAAVVPVAASAGTRVAITAAASAEAASGAAGGLQSWRGRRFRSAADAPATEWPAATGFGRWPECAAARLTSGSLAEWRMRLCFHRHRGSFAGGVTGRGLGRRRVLKLVGGRIYSGARGP